MHAYGLLDIGEITLADDREKELAALYEEQGVSYEPREDGFKQRLVLLRNPWGYGEWKGVWSDCVDNYFERRVYNPEIIAKVMVMVMVCPQCGAGAGAGWCWG